MARRRATSADAGRHQGAAEDHIAVQTAELGAQQHSADAPGLLCGRFELQAACADLNTMMIHGIFISHSSLPLYHLCQRALSQSRGYFKMAIMKPNSIPLRKWGRVKTLVLCVKRYYLV